MPGKNLLKFGASDVRQLQQFSCDRDPPRIGQVSSVIGQDPDTVWRQNVSSITSVAN